MIEQILMEVSGAPAAFIETKKQFAAAWENWSHVTVTSLKKQTSSPVLQRFDYGNRAGVLDTATLLAKSSLRSSKVGDKCNSA